VGGDVFVSVSLSFKRERRVLVALVGSAVVKALRVVGRP
jgi:hypothetical protein